MKLNWSSQMIKYALFVFNLLFVITGIIVIAVGVSVKAYYYGYSLFLDDKYFSLPNLLIATGSLIFFISFFGCCGALKENHCMIFTFSALLILIFILEFAAGIAGYVLRNETKDYLENKLTETMKLYNQKNENATTRMWDIIQKNFECCGVVNASDWLNINVDDKKNKINLPISCCVPKYGAFGVMNCNLDDTGDSDYFQRGCEEAFGGFLRDHAVTIGGVGITIAFIQMFGIIFACHLAKQIRYAYTST